MRFQGNPVKTCPRIHSRADHATTSPTARATAVRPALANKNANPAYRAKSAGMPITANGNIHPCFAAKTKSALPIQYKPAAKYPNPNHQPVKKDRHFVRVSFSGPFFGLFNVHNKAGKIAYKTGTAYAGGSASVAVTPSPKATRYNRQP
jgi:hypothetical protein